MPRLASAIGSAILYEGHSSWRPLKLVVRLFEAAAFGDTTHNESCARSALHLPISPCSYVA